MKWRGKEKAERRPGKAGRRRLVRWLGAAAVGSAACHQVAAGQEEAGVTARDTAGWRVLQRCGLGRGGAARLVHGSACAGHGARPGGGRAWRLPGVGSAWATPVKTGAGRAAAAARVGLGLEACAAGKIKGVGGDGFGTSVTWLQSGKNGVVNRLRNFTVPLALAAA
uniref:Uncharacterized protein n=1 Tax=Oryza rufipogon TaxID=4529 RepID=A0A0E0QWL6_ORYRU